MVDRVTGLRALIDSNIIALSPHDSTSEYTTPVKQGQTGPNK